MEPARFTKRSSDCFEIPELNLPDAPDFVSRPPQVSMEEMMRWSEELREWFPAGLKTPKERWAAKTEVAFTMD